MCMVATMSGTMPVPVLVASDCCLLAALQRDFAKSVLPGSALAQNFSSNLCVQEEWTLQLRIDDIR